MRTIPLSEFRTDPLAVLRSVQKTRRPVRVAQLGEPLAEIHPVPIDAAENERLRAERDAREIEIINRNAAQLNADALDLLNYGTSGRCTEARRPKKRKAGDGNNKLPLRPLKA